MSRAFAVAGALALALAADSFAQPLARAAVADRLVVRKADRTLTLFWHGAALKSYRVALGGRPLGAKQELGDQRTPEGLYLAKRRSKETSFHAALELSYPNPDDLARAKAAGVRPGSGIEIHGLRDGFEWLGSAHAIFDWTDGCIALSNGEIDELVRAVPDGTPVEILP
ncbi:MAG: murein L,D-transpeptidase family protein [Myxococcota bacterium]